MEITSKAKLTRRQLAVAAIAPAALAVPQQPAPPADDLQAARDRLKAAVNAVNGITVPMSTEPAFQFKAG